MKSTIIFSVFIVLVQGSLFGEFQDAMSSLTNGFQKLISDVVTDVKETIDCTIIAVETALSISSIVSSPFNSKCNSVVYENHDKYETLKKDNDRKESMQSFHSGFTFDDKQENNYLLNKVIKHLEVMNNKDVKSARSNRSNFENEHNLIPVVLFLKTEIEKISLNISEELRMIESGQKSIVDCIVKYINLLHSLESKSKKDSELTEVRRILDSASKILNLNVGNHDADYKVNKSLTSLELNSNNKFDDTLSLITNSSSKKDSELNQIGKILEDTSKIIRANASNVNANDKGNKSLTNLELKSSNTKNDILSSTVKSNITKNTNIKEVQQVLDGISKILGINDSNGDANDKVNKSLSILETNNNEKNDSLSSTEKPTSGISGNPANSNSSTKTFKSIFTKALLTTSPPIVNIQNNESENIYSTEDSALNDMNIGSLDYEPFFGHDSEEDSQEEALEDVRKLFADSEHANPILNDVFDKADQSDSDILNDLF